MPNDLICRLPFGLRLRAIHVCITDIIYEEQPSFDAVLTQKVQMRDSVRELIKSLGPGRTGFGVKECRSLP
jgi:hypothetical protein